MKARLIALGFVWAVSITGAAWAISANSSRSVNRAEVTLGEAQKDRSMSAAWDRTPEAAHPRKVLGAWLFAITGTAVVFRSRKSRTL
jgi:hypothetical protein